MAIVLTEVVSIHGSTKRMVFYRCTDDAGGIHKYGPVITNDPAFDAEAYKSTVAAKVADTLAAIEFDAKIGEI